MSRLNDIPNGWVETTLGEIGTLARGKSKHRPRWAPHLFGGEYPFIQTGQVKSASKYIEEYEQTYSEEGLAQSKLWDKDTLCITIAANIAEIAILKFAACFPDSILGFIPNKKKSDLDFIYYNFSMVQAELRQKSIGSVQDNINLGTFERQKFLLPSLPEQKAIANILTAFDDKMENLQAQNRTLEQTAQTIFKEWFGKYQLGNDLPVGWRIGKLGEISKLKSGYAFKSKDFVDNSSFKALKIKDLKGNGNVSISEVSSIDEECTQIDRVQYFRLEQGDIVLAMSGNTTGKIGVVPPHSNEIYLNQRVGKFFLNNEEQKSFLYNFLMSGNFEDKILSMGYGSAQPNISPSQIESIDIIFPDNEKQIEYLNISNPIYDKVLMNNSQIQSLKKTRDTLLPKLMSGALRVNEFKEKILFDD